MMSNVDFQSVVKQGHALAALEASKMSHSLTDLSSMVGGQPLPLQAAPPSSGLRLALHAPSIEIEEAKAGQAPDQKESMDDKEKGEEEQLVRLAENKQEELLISHAVSSG